MNRWRDLIDILFIASFLTGSVIILACLIAGCRMDRKLSSAWRNAKTLGESLDQLVRGMNSTNEAGAGSNPAALELGCCRPIDGESSAVPGCKTSGMTIAAVPTIENGSIHSPEGRTLKNHPTAPPTVAYRVRSSL